MPKSIKKTGKIASATLSMTWAGLLLYVYAKNFQTKVEKLGDAIAA